MRYRIVAKQNTLETRKKKEKIATNCGRSNAHDGDVSTLDRKYRIAIRENNDDRETYLDTGELRDVQPQQDLRNRHVLYLLFYYIKRREDDMRA